MPEISPTLTSHIDAYAAASLGLKTALLMGRAGTAVAEAVMERSPSPCRVLLYCGPGNNGGDGYACARLLARRGYEALAVDVTGGGQRTPEGRAYLADYRREVGEPLTLAEAEALSSDILVDAVLGTGARLPLGEDMRALSAHMQKKDAYRIAIDLPLGVDAENGGADPMALPVDMTVALGFLKHGLLSYPARAYVGELRIADLGLDTPAVREHFAIKEHSLTQKTIRPLLPLRDPNGHKGSFGHLLLLAGSETYRGAALLAGAAALRMGAGLVTLAAPACVLEGALPVLPELILSPLAPEAPLSPALTEGKAAILFGPGVGISEATGERLRSLLTAEGCPLVLDADALTALAAMGEDGKGLLQSAKRKVILTPHPGELARLLGIPTSEVQANRLALARRFAARYPVTLVLKGAATIIAEGEEFYLNTSGSSALAKGGSGDVLAGAIASLLAEGLAPSSAARVAVWLHGAAGDRLAATYSLRGVRPADLPAEMAALLAEVES